MRIFQIISSVVCVMIMATCEMIITWQQFIMTQKVLDHNLMKSK